MEPDASIPYDVVDEIEYSPPPKRRREEPALEWKPDWTKRFGDDSASLLTAYFPFEGLARDCVTAVRDLLVKNPPIKIYGKPYIQHRSVGFFSFDPAVKSYNYSTGNEMPAQAPPTALRLLMEAMKGTGGDYNAVLVNCYTDGSDYIGAHSDKADFICPKTGVVSLSVGNTRIFRVRDKTTKAIVCDVPLLSGMLCAMTGPEFQTRYTHEIVKIANAGFSPRYSFTFRKHKATE